MPRGAAVRCAEWMQGHPRAAIAAVLLIAPVFLLRDAILGAGALYQRDIHLYWHGEAEAFVRAVASGSWPVWDRTVGFGQPLLANSSAQVLYPLTWLNLLIRPWWYYTLFVVVHLVLSATGLYLACRRLDCSRMAALGGAVLWTACGPFLSYTILWHHFAGAAWMPWVLAAALHLGSARTTRAALALALVLAAQVLAGSFDMVAMGGATAAAAILWRLSWPRPWQAGDRRLLGGAALACVLAIGLSAAQWMPTMELALRSGRRSLPRETRAFWSLHPLSVADLVFPGFSATAPVSEDAKKSLFEDREPFLASLYLGLPAAGLVVAGFLDRRRRGALLLAAAGAAALLVALGRHTPVYEAMVTALPPLQAFRYPVKAMVLVGLCWCVLAARGVDFLRSGSAESRRASVVRVAAVCVALLAATVALGLLAAGVDRGARHLAVAAVMGGVGAWFVTSALGRGRGSRTAPAVAAWMVAACDLMLYHRALNDVSPIDLYTHRPEVIRHLDQTADGRVYAYDYSVPGPGGEKAGDASVHRLARLPAGWPTGPALALAQQMSLTPLAASRWGLMGSFEVDYTGLVPVHMNQAAYFLRRLEGSPPHLRLLQMAAVRNVVARHEDPFADLRPVAIVPGLFEASIRVFAVPDPAPRAFVAARTRVGEGLSGIAALIDPQFDFRREALIPATAPAASGTNPGTARIVSARPDRLRLEVDAPDGGYLVVLETYDPGWQATVDGDASPVVPANILFRGIKVAPGAHTVEMIYRPRGLVLGLVLSLLSLLAAFAVGWRTSRPGDRLPEAAP